MLCIKADSPTLLYEEGKVSAVYVRHSSDLGSNTGVKQSRGVKDTAVPFFTMHVHHGKDPDSPGSAHKLSPQTTTLRHPLYK